jgi:calmodulin
MAIDEDQMALITDAFSRHSKGGSVDAKMIGTAMRGVGLNPTEAQVSEWKKEAGGSVDAAKFKAMAIKKIGEANDSTDEITESFSVFDKDGNGYISAVEFKHILVTMGEALSEKEIKEVMKEVDIDSHGMINYNEFASIIYTPK